MDNGNVAEITSLHSKYLSATNKLFLLQPCLKCLDLKLAEIAVCYKNPVVPEAPVCDVTYGKHHHLQLEDSTISLYMLFTLGSVAAI